MTVTTRSVPRASVASRQSFDGVIIAGVFGTVWALWAAAALNGAASIAAIVVGLVCGAVLVTAAVRCRSRAASGSLSMFGSVAYRVLVAAEVAAFIGGQVVLNDAHQQKYLPVWVALIVGAHLLAFGRLFTSFFYAVGAAMIVAGLIGVCVGLTGSGAHRVQAVTGVLAALVVFAAGARRMRPRRRGVLLRPAAGAGAERPH